MLEQIGTVKGTSIPCKDAVRILRGILRKIEDPVVIEVGVGVGATTLALAEILDNRGRILIFDFEEKVAELKKDLEDRGFRNVEAFGNTHKTSDSYSWQLARLAQDSIATGPFVDFAYLDGAHNFLHDAPAAVALKALTKPGGYILLDDIHWTYADSPSINPIVNPALLDRFTDEQINAEQVAVVRDLVFAADRDFEHLVEGVSNSRALYRKRLPEPPKKPWWRVWWKRLKRSLRRGQTKH